MSNGIGQRVAYWMHKEHPSDYATLDIAGLRRVPADQVLHIYEPLRPGQLRGQPLLTQVLLRMFDLDKFDDATLLREEIANLFTGFITKPSPEQYSFLFSFLTFGHTLLGLDITRVCVSGKL